jgi:hypothetical protein
MFDVATRGAAFELDLAVGYLDFHVGGIEIGLDEAIANVLTNSIVRTRVTPRRPTALRG